MLWRQFSMSLCCSFCPHLLAEISLKGRNNLSYLFISAWIHQCAFYLGAITLYYIHNIHFIGEWYLETKIWVLGAHCYWGVTLSTPSLSSLFPSFLPSLPLFFLSFSSRPPSLPPSPLSFFSSFISSFLSPSFPWGQALISLVPCWFPSPSGQCPVDAKDLLCQDMDST